MVFQDLSDHLATFNVNNFSDVIISEKVKDVAFSLRMSFSDNRRDSLQLLDCKQSFQDQLKFLSWCTNETFDKQLQQTEDFKGAKMLNKKMLYKTGNDKYVFNNLYGPYKYDAATVISAKKIIYLKMDPLETKLKCDTKKLGHKLEGI